MVHDTIKHHAALYCGQLYSGEQMEQSIYNIQYQTTNGNNKNYKYILANIDRPFFFLVSRFFTYIRSVYELNYLNYISKY